MKKGLLFTCLIFALNLSVPVFADRCDRVPDDTLKVGVIHAPPFSMHSEKEEWTGISVELWRQLADRLGASYVFCDQSADDSILNVATGLQQVQQDKLDVALGALTLTSTREQQGDFSHPFFRTGLSIATRPDSHTWDELWQWATKPTSIAVLLFLIFMAPVLALLIRWLERDQNQELLEGPRGRSFATTVLWITLLCTGRAGAFDMQSFTARVLATILSFAGVTVLASIVAVATSSTVLSNLDNQIYDIKTLDNSRVAVVKGTSVERFMDNHGINSQSYHSLQQALQALMKNRVDAVVHDRPTLQYAIRMRSPERRPKLHDKLLNEEFYGFYLQQKSPLREQINQQLPALLASNQWQNTLRHYLGPQAL